MTTLQWRQANPFSILVDNNTDKWNAGHVEDILSNGPATIVASQTGGVWLINHYRGERRLAAYPAKCLSDDWTYPNMSCLEFGPDGRTQVFAGVSNADIIYAMTFEQVFGGINHVRTTTITFPWRVGGIVKLSVQKDPRRIIAACGIGVFWSEIPSSLDDSVGYSWTRVSGLPAGRFSGLALGPGTSVVAAAWGYDLSTGHFGLFTGQWNAALTDLVFSRATISGSDQTKMKRTSIASCASDRRVMYSVAGGDLPDGRDSMFASWTTMTIPTGEHGHNEWWNNCIDVNPFDSKIVALGWTDGPYFSTDGAGSWTKFDLPHEDIHCVYSTGDQNDRNAFFVGSDGDVALVRGSGEQNSAYNIQLANLQLYPSDEVASKEVAGLFAAGLQDNGNLYCVVDPKDASLDRPWFQLDGGDGGINRLLQTGHLLRFNNTLTEHDDDGDVEVGNVVRATKWDPARQRFAPGLGTIIPVDGIPKGDEGLHYPIMEVVKSPKYARKDDILWAIGGGRDASGGTAQKLWGLFADKNGDGMHWTAIAEVGMDIISVASVDGTRVIVGTKEGYISACNTKTGALFPMVLSTQLNTMARSSTGSIAQLIVQSDSVMFALHTSGYILRYSNGFWETIAGIPPQAYNSIEADWTKEPNTLYAATDTTVFASFDNGQTWVNESNGLPVNPHCRDLRFVQQPNGLKYLYLSTYGRSLWRTEIDLPPQSHHGPLIPLEVVHIISGVIQDGGGWTLPGGPVPPWDPLVGLMGGVAASALARTLPATVGRVRARDAIEAVSIGATHFLRSGEWSTADHDAIGLDVVMEVEHTSHSKPGAVKFKRILEILEKCHDEADTEQELIGGLLAAALAARRGGSEGNKLMREALQFVVTRPEDSGCL